MFIFQMNHSCVVPKTHGLNTTIARMSRPLKSSQIR